MMFKFISWKLVSSSSVFIPLCKHCHWIVDNRPGWHCEYKNKLCSSISSLQYTMKTIVSWSEHGLDIFFRNPGPEAEEMLGNAPEVLINKEVSIWYFTGGHWFHASIMTNLKLSPTIISHFFSRTVAQVDTSEFLWKISGYQQTVVDIDNCGQKQWLLDLWQEKIFILHFYFDLLTKNTFPLLRVLKRKPQKRGKLSLFAVDDSYCSTRHIQTTNHKKSHN